MNKHCSTLNITVFSLNIFCHTLQESNKVQSYDLENSAYIYPFSTGQTVNISGRRIIEQFSVYLATSSTSLSSSWGVAKMFQGKMGGVSCSYSTYNFKHDKQEGAHLKVPSSQSKVIQFKCGFNLRSIHAY